MQREQARSLAGQRHSLGEAGITEQLDVVAVDGFDVVARARGQTTWQHTAGAHFQREVAACGQAMARYDEATEQGVHILRCRNGLKTAIEEDGGVGVAAHLLLGPEALWVVVDEQIFTGDDQIQTSIAIDIGQLDAAVGQARQGGGHLLQDGVAGAAGEQIGGHRLVDAELRNRHDRTGGRAAIEVAKATDHKVVVAIAIKIADRHGAAAEPIKQSLRREGEGHGGTGSLAGEA